MSNIDETNRTNSIQYTGYFQNNIRKNLEQGKVNINSEEMRIQNKLEEERKKVQPIYNSRGKIIEQNDSGRHLDILA